MSKASRFLEKPNGDPVAVRAGALLLTIGLIWSMMVLRPWAPMPYLRAGLLAICLFFIPGFLLRVLILPDVLWPMLVQIPLSFGLSLGVGAVAWLACRVLGGSLNLFGLLLGGTLTTLAAAAILLRQIRPPALGSLAKERLRYGILALALLVAVILFWTLIVLRIGAYYMPRTDNWYYLGVVRSMLVSESLAPGDPFFAGVADAERRATMAGHGLTVGSTRSGSTSR